MLSFLLLAIGLLLLVKGADWLVNGASALARHFGVSDLAIGLSLVAFGTSTPELIVSLLAALRGSPDVAVSNVVGSNIGNILLIVGISAMVYPLLAGHGTVWKEIPFMLLASALLLVQAADPWLDGAAKGVVTRSDGLVMLGVFAVFLYYIGLLLAEARQQPDGSERESPCSAARPRMPVLAVALIAPGLLMLFLGGHWVVQGAVGLAQALGISERVIGLTVVAMGTSLPEMATSVVASLRKNAEIALGNIVGSNIFNILFILGLCATVQPLDLPKGGLLDAMVMTGAALLLFLTMFVGSPARQVQRAEGVGFVGLYAAYLVWLGVSG